MMMNAGFASGQTALPLSRENFVNALANATSGPQEQILLGGQQLESWEKQPGYSTFLQDTFADLSLPIDIRYLAIIKLKHSVDKFYRKAAAHTLKPEEKATLKIRALEIGSREPEPRLALQNAIIVAKIVRWEFPNDWPDALNLILELLRSAMQPGSNPVQLPRTLLIMLYVTKDLSSARLQKIRKSLLAVAPEVVHLLSNIYIEKVKEGTAILETDGANLDNALFAFQSSLLAMKSLRRLVVSGFEHPNRDPFVQEVWALSLTYFANFLAFLRSPLNMPPQLSGVLEKHLLQLAKMHLEMARVHPPAFVQLPESIRLVQSYWTFIVELGNEYGQQDQYEATIGTDGDSGDEPTIQEKLGLKALLLLRSCIKLVFYPIHSFRYQHAQDKEEKNSAIDTVRTQLLTEPFVIEIMELLVTRFFRFHPSDLRRWEEEPEEWEKREEEIADAWEFSIRSCSERVFMDLVVNFKALLAPRLLHVFHSYATPNNQDVVLKDAIYAAIGLAAPCVEKDLDFHAFLQTNLVQEVAEEKPGANILRRRIAILLGQWAPIQSEILETNHVYQILQHLLNRNDPLNDQVVRVTTARKLKNVLEPFEFQLQVFLPFATPILQEIFGLIDEVTLIETKMALLEVVRILVVKMEDNIAPFTDHIISMLPGLWENSGEEFLMKQAILTLLSSIIISLKQDSVRYHPIILPLIQQAADPDSESHEYLREEAIDLWLSVVSQAPSPATPELISLFPALFKIFDQGLDSMRQALDLVQSYIMLAPQELLTDPIRDALCAALNNLLSMTTRHRLGIVPHLAEMLVRCVAIIGEDNDQAYGVIAKSFLDTSLMKSILDGLYDAYDAGLSVGPNSRVSDIFGPIKTDYFSVLARLALGSPKVFVANVQAAHAPATESQTMEWLLKEWFGHWNDISDVTRKKMHALALTRLLSVNGSSGPPPDYLLLQLQSYMEVWTSMIVELSDTGGYDDNNDDGDGDGAADGGGSRSKNKDYLISWNEDEPDHTGETPEVTRQLAWHAADPTYKLVFGQFVNDIFRGVVQACGGLEAFTTNWLVNVDTHVVRAFQPHLEL